MLRGLLVVVVVELPNGEDKVVLRPNTAAVKPAANDNPTLNRVGSNLHKGLDRFRLRHVRDERAERQDASPSQMASRACPSHGEWPSTYCVLCVKHQYLTAKGQKQEGRPARFK